VKGAPNDRITRGARDRGRDPRRRRVRRAGGPARRRSERREFGIRIDDARHGLSDDQYDRPLHARERRRHVGFEQLYPDRRRRRDVRRQRARDHVRRQRQRSVGGQRQRRFERRRPRRHDPLLLDRRPALRRRRRRGYRRHHRTRERFERPRRQRERHRLVRRFGSQRDPEQRHRQARTVGRRRYHRERYLRRRLTRQRAGRERGLEPFGRWYPAGQCVPEQPDRQRDPGRPVGHPANRPKRDPPRFGQQRDGPPGQLRIRAELFLDAGPPGRHLRRLGRQRADEQLRPEHPLFGRRRLRRRERTGQQHRDGQRRARVRDTECGRRADEQPRHRQPLLGSLSRRHYFGNGPEQHCVREQRLGRGTRRHSGPGRGEHRAVVRGTGRHAPRCERHDQGRQRQADPGRHGPRRPVLRGLRGPDGRRLLHRRGGRWCGGGEPLAVALRREFLVALGRERRHRLERRLRVGHRRRVRAAGERHPGSERLELRRHESGQRRTPGVLRRGRTTRRDRGDPRQRVWHGHDARDGRLHRIGLQHIHVREHLDALPRLLRRDPGYRRRRGGQ